MLGLKLAVKTEGNLERKLLIKFGVKLAFLKCMDESVLAFLKCMDGSVLVSLKNMGGSVLAHLRFSIQSGPTRFPQSENPVYHSYYARKAPKYSPGNKIRILLAFSYFPTYGEI